jgi:hypothetical protein
MFLFIVVSVTFSQQGGSRFVEISTWTLTQLLPSPSFYDDANAENSNLKFGLKWNITPVNFSFNANKLVSPVQFFKVNPMRRYGGSVELFVQPEWGTSGSKYSGLKRFSMSPGIKAYIPLVEYGEYLAGSLGIKYSIRKNNDNDFHNYAGLEFGIYTFFGIAGFTFTYNFDDRTRYNFSISLRYY